jgi:hypothetical protein
VEDEETDPVVASDAGADFSACEGLTGLDDAICRLEALLAVHPDNQGLQKSLGQLQEKKAKHEGSARDHDVASKDGSADGSSSGQGQSGESHGNGGANGGGNGKANDKAKGNANGH